MGIRAMAFARSTVGTILVLLAAPAVAAGTELVDKWEIRIGSYLASLDTDFRADPNNFEQGTAIDLEKDLGFDDSENLLRLTVAYRIKRHQVAFGYYEFSRDASKRIPFEIEFQDEVFPVDALVDSRYDWTAVEGRYTYWPVMKAKTAVGVGAGVLRLSVGVLLEVGAGRLEQRIESEVDVDELIPELGAQVRHAVTPKLMFKAGINGVFFDLEDIDGEVIEVGAGFEHQTTKHVGVGASFSFFDLDVDDTKDRFVGTYEVTVSGLQVYLPIRF